MNSIYPLAPVQSCIIASLAHQPHQTTAELETAYHNTTNNPVSQASFYRIIQQLVSAQVLVKQAGKLALHQLWVLDFLDLSTVIQAHYAPRSPEILHMQPGERRVFLAESFLDLDPLWADLNLKVAQLYPHETWYCFKSHPWHELVLDRTELALFQHLDRHTQQLIMLYGQNTWLDQYGLERVRAKNISAQIASSHPFPPNSYLVDVCGDFIFECLLPEGLARHFQFLFEHIDQESAFDRQLFMDLMQHKQTIKLTLQRDPKLAQTIRNHIQALL